MACLLIYVISPHHVGWGEDSGGLHRIGGRDEVMHEVERLRAFDVGAFDDGAAAGVEPFMVAMIVVLEAPSPWRVIGFAGRAA